MKVLKFIFLIILLTPLASCYTQITAPLQDNVLIHILLVDEVVYKGGWEAYGVTRCQSNVCVIQIRRDKYPQCITHEIRHAFEGNWHKGRESVEDCD